MLLNVVQGGGPQRKTLVLGAQLLELGQPHQTQQHLFIIIMIIIKKWGLN